MKNIGLALGGGAVLGASHVGSLRAIHDYEIKVTHLAGTSIGAFVGAFYAFGMNYKEINLIASELNWLDISSISLSRYGLLSNDKMGKLITEYLGNKNIEDAEIPLAVVTTDISTGEKVVLKKGPLAKAVMASTSIPGIFKPVEIQGRMLVDGGVVENVPIQSVKDLGAKYVMGIDLNAKNKYERPNDILDVILNSFHYLLKQTVRLQTQDADLLIEPDLSQFNHSETNQVDDLIEKGYTDSKKILKEHFKEKQADSQKVEISESFINKHKKHFKSFANDKIEKLSNKIENLKSKQDHPQENQTEQIKNLESQLSILQDKYEELIHATDEKWEELKEGFNQATHSIKKGILKIF